MPFEFDSSTPLSIKNMNIRRPLTPLIDNSRNTTSKPAESYLKPASRPLKSILKKPLASQGNKSILDSLKGTLFPRPAPDQHSSISNEDNRVAHLKKQIQMLEEQNTNLLRSNKSNSLKQEMEKHKLEVENELLKREIESLKNSNFTNDRIGSLRSRVSRYGSGNYQKLSDISDLYKIGNEADEKAELKSIHEKIEQRRQHQLASLSDQTLDLTQSRRRRMSLDQDILGDKLLISRQSPLDQSVLTEKLLNLELSIRSLSQKLPANEDLLLIDQIKKILNHDEPLRKRQIDEYLDDHRTAKRLRKLFAELSPSRF